jgi:hypothetical protein
MARQQSDDLTAENADPRPEGVFRLADFRGAWVEGVYLEVTR